MGDHPYIRVKDIVNWDVYKDPTAKIPDNIYNKMQSEKKLLHEKDILFVRRGSYRIGSVAMISPYDKDVILTREILVLRVNKNGYNITPFYMLYLLSHHLTNMQSKNKVLIETTLPNIGDRWKEICLPVAKDICERNKISAQIENIIKCKWDALSKIIAIQNELGDFNT